MPFRGPFSLGLRALLVVDYALVYSLRALVLMPTGPWSFYAYGPSFLCLRALVFYAYRLLIVIDCIAIMPLLFVEL